MTENKKWFTSLTKENAEYILDKELKAGIYTKRPLLKAMRLKCLDCCGGSNNEVKLCTCEKTCFLHPFRMGKNPFSVGRALSEEQKAKMNEALKKSRLAKNNETEEDELES